MFVYLHNQSPTVQGEVARTVDSARVGNNDFDEERLKLAMDFVGGLCLSRGGEICLGGKRIAVTHGDLIREVNYYSGAFPADRGNALSGVFEFAQVDEVGPDGVIRLCQAQ